MIKLFLFFFFLGCAHQKKDVFSPEELTRSMNIIDEVETKYVFGPTQKAATHFVDKTEEYGLGGIKGYNFNVVDLDADGFSDLVVLESFYDTPLFFRYNPELKKFEKFTHSFFRKNIKASYLLFYDFNRDGLLDVLVGVLNQKSEIEKSPLALYNGKMVDGNLVFRKNPKALVLNPGPHASVVPIDYNLDGKLDLYVSNWFEMVNNNPTPMPDVFLENKNGIFKVKNAYLTDEYERNPGDTAYVNATPTFGASVCDVDQNGFPDILTATTNGAVNKLWLNMYRLRAGQRYYKNFGRESRYAADAEGNLNPFGGGRTFISLCADYNDDGIMDVFLGEVSHSYDALSVDKSSILTGSRFKFPPLFIRTEYFKESESSLWHQSDKRAIWQDFNNDGLLDLLIDNSGYPPHTRMVLFEQDGTHAFEDKALEYGINIINPQNTVYLDVNQDGKLDILTGQSNIRNAKIEQRLYLFENQIETNAKIYRFYLRGEKSNDLGLGAMLIFKINKNDEIIYRRRNVEYSYGGLPAQNEMGIHLALPEGEKLLWVKVRWPYASEANAEVSNLEKIYKLPDDSKKLQNITLCENGKVVSGKMRACR